MRKLSLGCFADDFTGASDAASFIKKSGMRTVLVSGIPSADMELPENTECVVIALKIRTIPKAEAVRLALQAYAWLKQAGAEHIYYKYCSTFDSTDEGNIGPIIDAILDKYDLQRTVLCPALPVNGRTVKGGHLYVNGVPLNESHMRFHPLTPMLSSYIPTLMSKQGKYPCVVLDLEHLDTVCQEGQKLYLVPDYYEDKHAELLAQQYHAYPFLTGGSGVLTALAGWYRTPEAQAAPKVSQEASADQRALLLAGSCSAATLGQIKCFQRQGKSTLKVNPAELFAGPDAEEQVLHNLLKQLTASENTSILIYSSSNPEEVRAAQAQYGMENVSAKLEGLMARLAAKVVELGWRRIIVAGGETSGAVTEALQADAYEIGPEIAPGVPIMYPLRQKGLQLALKSGNFGQEDFFMEALHLME